MLNVFHDGFLWRRKDWDSWKDPRRVVVCLLATFLKSNGKFHKDKYLPFRLCKTVQKGYDDGKVGGFISDFAAEELFSWAEIGAHDAAHLDTDCF